MVVLRNHLALLLQRSRTHHSPTLTVICASRVPAALRRTGHIPKRRHRWERRMKKKTSKNVCSHGRLKAVTLNTTVGRTQHGTSIMALWGRRSKCFDIFLRMNAENGESAAFKDDEGRFTSSVPSLFPSIFCASLPRPAPVVLTKGRAAGTSTKYTP